MMRAALTNIDIDINLLALAPFLLLVTSIAIGLKLALLIIILLFIQALLCFAIRTFIVSNFYLPTILIIGITIAAMVGLLLQAESVAMAEVLALWFPLLTINSLVLATSEKALSMPDLNSVLSHLAGISIVIFAFFLLFSLIRSVLVNVPIFTQPAGCFLLIGLLFALMNYIKRYC